MDLKLVIGNKNYSSWSFRPWIALTASHIAFEEILIPFGEPIGNPAFKAEIRRYTPADKVPVLIDGDVHVWETLAILEYLAERFPQARLWPADVGARAHARAIASEMHAGFAALRQHCAMNMRRPVTRRELPTQVRDNVARIDAMWTDCRNRFGAGGRFLFGHFTAADAMYAPVVSRFRTYDVEIGAAAQAYMSAMMGLPAWAAWEDAARKETWIVPEDEVDWPTVLNA
jgi:glutathione S-transferase